jgi:hypothetical protein
MSIGLSDNNTWYSSKWITFKLFSDCLLFLTEEGELMNKIFFLNKVSIDFLDLKIFDARSIALFSTVLDKVILYNEELQGSDFKDPSYFSMYYDKLLELRELISNEYGSIS